MPAHARRPLATTGNDRPYCLTASRPCSSTRRDDRRDGVSGLGPALTCREALQRMAPSPYRSVEPDAPTRTRPNVPRGGRSPMSLGSPVRTVLAMLASALLAVALPAPGEGKVLRTNLRADPAMVDPITYSELVAGDVMKNLYEGFTEIDKEGNVIPALALRWDASPDNKGFRFYLRKGVKFHSGREFTAKDVK